MHRREAALCAVLLLPQAGCPSASRDPSLDLTTNVETRDASSDGGLDPDSRWPSDLYASYRAPPCLAPVGESLAPDAFPSPDPDTRAYRPLPRKQRRALRESLLAALVGNATRAVGSAHAAGYTVCLADDVWQWHPVVAAEGSPRVAVRRGATMPLIFEVPHPRFDIYTHEEALALFEQMPARALVISGTHRCANPEPSGCTGRTSVCGVSAEPFRESDMAHVQSSAFQAAHDALATLFPADLVISFHGMGARGVSLSNGTKKPISVDDPVARFATALQYTLPGERVTTCNDYPSGHRRVHLCGTTNVQGRALNGATHACTAAARSASQRFIHFEQSEFVRLRISEVAAALAMLVGPPRERVCTSATQSLPPQSIE